MAKYFKKINPKNAVVIPTGQKILFATLDDLTGYHVTDSDDIAAYFKKCTEEQRYGISEISAAEYEQDYTEKKRSGINLKPTWQREAFGGRSRRTSPLHVLGAPAVHAAVSTSDEKRVVNLGMDGEDYLKKSAPPSPSAPVAPEQLPAVTTGKRKNR